MIDLIVYINIIIPLYGVRCYAYIEKKKMMYSYGDDLLLIIIRISLEIVSMV